MVNSIGSVGADRFDSRIPPGFQDRNKRERVEPTQQSDVDSVIGNNRWGDLLLWKEILALAQVQKARHAIILTNDQKNDWQLGGRDAPTDAEMLKLKSSWKPLPFAHPMLSLEAKLIANVSSVSLLDSVYMGVLLHRHGGPGTSAFVDVSIVPDPPAPPSQKDRQKELTKAYKLQQAEAQSIGSPTESATEAGNSELGISDAPKLRASQAIFAKALYSSRAKMESDTPAQPLLEKFRAAIVDGQSVSDLLTSDNLADLDNNMLVSVARDLHDEGLGGALGHPEALTDIIGMLDRLPPLTAACIYLGFLASMYLVRDSNAPREQPSSPIDGLIFAVQNQNFAAVGIDVLTKRFRHEERKPLYLPNKELPEVLVSVRHQPNADGEVILESIRIAGEEVLSRAQIKEGMNLIQVFQGAVSMPVGDVVQFACKRFAVPLHQIKTTDDMNTVYKFPAELGLKEPRDVGKLELEQDQAAE